MLAHLFACVQLCAMIFVRRVGTSLLLGSLFVLVVVLVQLSASRFVHVRHCVRLYTLLV